MEKEKKVIYIGNDHGGCRLKKIITAYLDEHGIPYINVGTDTEEIVRYPYYAEKVAKHVEAEPDARGILICSTGIGMSMAANKFKGVRAALCTDPYMAKMTRKHNNSNVLCLGGQVTGVLEALDMVELWLTTEFEGGRHCISLGLIDEIEDALLSMPSQDGSVMEQGR